MKYDRYFVFYAVAKHRSFTAAAKALYTSQPAITRTIKNLEDDLGCRLFSRGKKGVELTPEGVALYRHVELAVNHIAQAEEEISASLSLDSGTISIAATATALNDCLYAEMDEFHRLYPKVRFRISTQSSDETIAKLRAGACDFAFVSTPYRHYEGLKAKTIKTFENVLIAGNEFAYLKKGKHTLAELASLPFISLGSNMQLRSYIDELFGSEGVYVTPAIELDSANTIVPMVVKNFGISILPKSFALPALEEGSIFIVPLVKPLPKRDIVMLTDPSSPFSIADKRFASMFE